MTAGGPQFAAEAFLIAAIQIRPCRAAVLKQAWLARS
jgi:hypothetical protein